MNRMLPSCLCFLLGGALSAQAADTTVEFNRDIRPILSDNCFTCHGPDKANRKGKLRLDVAEDALADRGGYHAIVPRNSDKSEVIRRILAKGKDQMPPISSGHKLSARQIDLLRRWIDQGAVWQKHWSFLAPQRASLPEVKNRKWLRNGIDHFVLARLEQEGLAPAPEADRITLLRRVSLDLTGLPPTPAEVDAFLADKSADAYEKVVDRLLASPRYGERMALPWLAAARYADTNGYQTDGDRIMWRWRDWVIDAFNKNLPFDQFTIEQIAGDMLPKATLEQKIATGFNRNHRGNSEGGVIPEEYAVEYVVDRVDTTSTVWLGLTMGCAKCHDHKYDPISQQEFYQVFAYFNNVPEKGKAIKYGNSPPYIKAPTREQSAKLFQLIRAKAQADKRFGDLQGELDKAQLAWEQRGIGHDFTDWNYHRGLLRHLPLVHNGSSDSIRNILLYTPTNRSNEFALVFDGTRVVEAGNTGAFGFFDKFTISAWVFPQGKRGGTIVSRMVDSDRADGYSLSLQDGKIHVQLVKRWLDDAIRVETAEPLPLDRWQHVAFSYDGSRLAAGVKIYVNGKLAKLKVNLDDLNQSFNTKEPFRVGGGGGKDKRFVGGITEVRIYDHVVAGADIALLANTDSLGHLGFIPREARSAVQAYKVRSYYLDKYAPDDIRKAYQDMLTARAVLEKYDEGLPTSMVMQEMATPRDTHVLIRGEYDKKGVKVSPGLPKSWPPLPNGAPNNRLGFAKWLVDPANPLTARVTVNRYWQHLFGQGIVRSVEDFGAQGDWPSHAGLLDWLATEFQGQGKARPWDIKHILKTIVTSATYRQASRVTKQVLLRDPENRLLARGPRMRLSAEIIRDQALFASGLLVETLGGPSVKPYQPPGLQKELSGTEEFQQDHGPSLYRRSLYTYWKRTVAPPAMMTFDAAGRETCIVRESRTNTPLQALNLMNDVTYVEAARVLAQRVLAAKKLDEKQRLALAFRLAVARPPSTAEIDILQSNLKYQIERFRNDPRAAQKLVSVGEYPRGDADVGQLAAFTAVASLILNLDEVITKE
jgi:hypothetical protein